MAAHRKHVFGDPGKKPIIIRQGVTGDELLRETGLELNNIEKRYGFGIYYSWKKNETPDLAEEKSGKAKYVPSAAKIREMQEQYDDCGLPPHLLKRYGPYLKLKTG